MGPSLGRQPWKGHSLGLGVSGVRTVGAPGRTSRGAGLTERPQGGARGSRAARTGPSDRMLPHPCRQVTGPAAIGHPPAGPPGACARGAEKEGEAAPPLFRFFLAASVFGFWLFFLFLFFLNPATLWSHPGPPASSHLLAGGCHTTDIFSGDSWPCGTQLKYGNGF